MQVCFVSEVLVSSCPVWPDVGREVQSDLYSPAASVWQKHAGLLVREGAGLLSSASQKHASAVCTIYIAGDERSRLPQSTQYQYCQ